MPEGGTLSLVHKSIPCGQASPRSLRHLLLSIPLVNPIVHGDGVGYYAYARAPLIQHSFHFEEDWRHANLNSRNLEHGRRTIAPYGIYGDRLCEQSFYHRPGSPLDSLSPGCRCYRASLEFFGHAHPHRRIFFPLYFRDGFWNCVLRLPGAPTLLSPREKIHGRKLGPVGHYRYWWGSSLPVYMYFNPAWSHAHSAFAVALFIWFWDHTRGTRTTQQWLLLGLMAGLMVDIYFPNSIFLLLPLIESLILYSQNVKSQTAGVRNLILQNVLFALTILVAFLPTILTRRIIFGGYFRFGSYSPISPGIGQPPTGVLSCFLPIMECSAGLRFLLSHSLGYFLFPKRRSISCCILRWRLPRSTTSSPAIPFGMGYPLSAIAFSFHSPPFTFSAYGALAALRFAFLFAAFIAVRFLFRAFLFCYLESRLRLSMGSAFDSHARTDFLP